MGEYYNYFWISINCIRNFFNTVFLSNIRKKWV